MSKVLIVDDEPRYREELELALSRAGDDIRLAGDGREAIEVGACYRPDVLVADWMLQDRVHGLHVAEVLRAVWPGVRTILITGYASADLREEAKRCDVFEFIEKPFHLARIQDAVRRAAQASRAPGIPLLVGIMEVDPDGRIRYANATAQDLLAQTAGGREAACLSELCPEGWPAQFDLAATRWVGVTPRAVQPIEWQIRARELPAAGTRLYVLVTEQSKHHKQHPIVRILLGLSEESMVRWPLASRAMLIDRSALVRRAVVCSLEGAGCLCHAAESAEIALRLFERDPKVKIVLVDYDLHDTDLSRLIGSLKSIRPDVTLVGTGAVDRRREFTAMGVSLFLEKPYVISDLVNLLTDRIGTCIDCGLPVPLRRPRIAEAGSSWVCCGCGARYYAVLDHGFPPDVLRHVRPADDGRPLQEKPDAANPGN